MKKYIIILVCLVLSVLAWLTKPVYDWAAYRGKAPILFAKQLPLIAQTLPTSSAIYKDTAINEAALLTVLKTYRQKSKAPGLSAAIAHKGSLLWTGTVGYADLSQQLPLNSHHQFRIGSTSKAMTATLMAQLIEKAEFDIDKPIENYLGFNPNPLWPEITSRQLASHSAGLPHYKENTDLLGLYYSMALNQHFQTPLDALKGFDGAELLSTPGSKFYYSSYGTVLLSAVLAEAAQQSFTNAIQEKVWQPLDMTNTGLEQDAKNLARFYFNNRGKQTTYTPWRPVDLSHRLAGGGFISTPSDLVKLGSGYLTPVFLKQTTVEAIWTPQKLTNGEINEQHYALGWRKSSKLSQHGVTVYHHGGVSRGSQSMLIVIPELELSIAANINVNTQVFWDFGEVVMALTDELIRQGV